MSVTQADREAAEAICAAISGGDGVDFNEAFARHRIQARREMSKEAEYAITAWAFANNIDGAERNSLLAAIRKLIEPDEGVVTVGEGM